MQEFLGEDAIIEKGKVRSMFKEYEWFFKFATPEAHFSTTSLS